MGREASLYLEALQNEKTEIRFTGWVMTELCNDKVLIISQKLK